jgi:anti-anti-sigma regulatory factor/anti-sigma regulatory factor (Ser/Thr protein kinase)
MTADLSCLHSFEPPVAVVRVAGRLHLATVPVLRTAVLKALADEPDAVLIEASALTADDDLHLAVLIALARYAAGWPTIPLLLCAPGDTVVEAMNRLGIDRHLVVCDSLDDGRARAAARTLPTRLTSSYPPTVETVAVSRRMVTDACRMWDIAHLVADAEVVVTELVSNAVLHAGTTLDLSVTYTGRNLHVAVRDRAVEPARLVGPMSVAEAGGRGLIIVEALAASWGCTPVRDGKVTWATLPRHPR